jgi:subtilase family serine protease
LSPLGTVPFDPNNTDMVNWAFEASLDVEWAHAMAPGASIVLLTSPVDETEGTQGMPDFLLLEQFALKHHLGSIISQSWGATEQTLLSPSGQKVVADFEAFYQTAAQQHVTVLASAGDYGSANFKLDLTTFYPYPTVIYPASSQWVTAVGGTSLAADTSGNYQSEVVWNDNNIGVAIATGGGMSAMFAEPSYQLGLNSNDQKILNGHRGIPDIAYNADPYTSILVYISFAGASGPGYYFIGGTSEGSPQWAALVAVGNQLAGHSLGFLNPALYRLGRGASYASSLHDITVGDNSNEGIPGYTAAAGWDPTTGWGTPNAANLLPNLAALH